MYALRIQFAVGDLNLQYKDWTRAKAAYDQLKLSEDPYFEMSDDYNRHACFAPQAATFIFLQDLDREVDASVDIAAFQRKANMRVSSQQGIQVPNNLPVGSVRRQ